MAKWLGEGLTFCSAVAARVRGVLANLTECFSVDYPVLVHTVTTTEANAGDVTQVENLLHGTEKRVHDDAGRTGA